MKTFLSPLLGAFLLAAMAAPVRGDLAPGVLVPRIASGWTALAVSPPLAELSRSNGQRVQLAIRQTAEDVWQLRVTAGAANETGPTETIGLWESATLQAADWKAVPPSPKTAAGGAESLEVAGRPVPARTVEPRPGHFYRFHSKPVGNEARTAVYHSIDPANFGLADKNGDAMHLVVTLPLAAPEIVQHDGEWFIAALRPDLNGVGLARLAWDEIRPTTLQPRQKGAPVRVALFDDYGSFGKGVPRCTELLAKAEGITVTPVKPALIRAGGLQDFDVVIFTGGSGSKQAATLGLLGREQVRRFIEAGGGYIGICAGNYLACNGFSWGLQVLDAKTKSSKWARGIGDVKIEFTELGQKILGMPAAVTDIRYANGPVFGPAGIEGIRDFQPLAYFRSELAQNGSPAGAMVDSPAMVAGSYGKGRILCSSPHPEQQAGMEHFVVRAVRWAAER